MRKDHLRITANKNISASDVVNIDFSEVSMLSVEKHDTTCYHCLRRVTSTHRALQQRALPHLSRGLLGVRLGQLLLGLRDLPGDADLATALGATDEAAENHEFSPPPMPLNHSIDANLKVAMVTLEGLPYCHLTTIWCHLSGYLEAD